MTEPLLELAASVLDRVVDEIVFVGGATIGLWQSEPAAPPARMTDDVDAICEAATRSGYQHLASRLRARGFREASDSPVICRWRHPESGLILDLMPDDERVFGFTNSWYSMAFETALVRRLPSGARIRAAAPPALLATKLEAWKGRGRGDVLRSLDVHDVVVLVDGRPELGPELSSASAELRAFVGRELLALRADPYFDYVIDSALQRYGRVADDRADLVRARIDALGDDGGAGGDALVRER
ncbi:MAG TPA: hypothetical protein VK506_08170 [Conexibacter sp.]|nr:hypothetical protein [Conexibacter sp.]